jgi:hypothetical protein
MEDLHARSTNGTCGAVQEVESSNSSGYGCTIEFLQKRPFTTMTFDEKTKIIGGERPKSELKIDTRVERTKIFHPSFSPASL